MLHVSRYTLTKILALREYFCVCGDAYKPNFVFLTVLQNGEETAISLVPALLPDSSELPNLFLHRNGFATSPCHHGTNIVAPYGHRRTFHLCPAMTEVLGGSYCLCGVCIRFSPA